MKTKAAPKKVPRPKALSVAQIGSDEWNRRDEAWQRKFKRMTKAQKRQWLISIGVLTPEGEIPVYPMDHVPLGPRH